MERLKYEIEINRLEDGRTFLNFWNYYNGDDYIAELIDGKLFHNGKNISFQKFINETSLRMNKILDKTENRIDIKDN